MKKIICLITIALMGVAAFAQTVTLTFTGRDAADHWIQLNRVAITNLTKSWQETIYWPDTTLTMQNGSGIDESVANGGFVLSQNNPNPFTGTTDVNLTVADAGAVTLEIVDGNGKTVGTHRVRPEIGTHQFRVSLSVAGTYVMTARQNGKTSSIKMVCNGGGNANGIDYLGMVQTITFVLKSTTNNPFNFGDMMEYVGFATINGTEMESQRITQAQGSSQTFVLQFDAIQLYVPVVSTDTVGDVATTSATCGGNVANDGGAAVISRGVCFNTTGTPTVNDSPTTDGNGMGSFVSLLDGLTPHTQYYVRAYATNSVGTAYGEERTFTTLCDLPEVTTTQPIDVTTTTFTCGGDVVAINCDELTARGLCWNTTGNPTVADNHTTEGTTAGSFTSSVTGLECGNTYFVRAYATNSVGTGYGDEYEVTTLEPTIPDVATLSATLYNVLSVIVTSEVTSENCEAVSSRGICYSTSPNPTINDLHTTHAIGSGILNDTITELDTGTTYYVRAYATNSLGTAYGEELSVTTPTLPTVTTASVTNITATTATSGGNVTDDGGAAVTARGVCWSISQNPTISDSHSTDGSGTGSFTSSITGLEDNTTYYVRAYATNSVGTAYGSELTFTTPTLPTVTTSAVTNIVDTHATSGGEVTDDGEATVTARGVCWSTSHNPTISDSHTTNGSGTGSFSSSITGLAYNTTYYVRAYATNSMGTAYGNEVSFTTPPFTCGTSTISDIDGNTYNTVLIGTQCWMKENLRTTKYADNTPITQDSACLYYSTSYGLFYNWAAVMRNDTSSNANPSGVQGICPNGWHVPSEAEWIQLIDYVSSQCQYVCGNDSTNIAKALASTSGWYSNTNTNTCSPGNTPTTNNTTGFNALPAECYVNTVNNTVETTYGFYTYFWSATEHNYTGSKCIRLDRASASVEWRYSSKADARSVRCVRDEGGVTLPTVIATPVTNITDTHATCGGTVTADGGGTVTARGVCWSTSPHPTVCGSHTTDGTDTGSFTSSITGLTAGTNYYVRAYATNSAGTAYGSEMYFTTTFTCGTSILTDIDGNTYNTVQIGTQCWMKENLRTTKYADGTSFSSPAHRYYPNNNSANKPTYGLLYNWAAVMRDASSSSANPSGVQGICPDGWHVPSDAEWTRLTNYVSSQSQYVCGSSSSQIAKALADTTGWHSTSTTCAVGNTPSNNNATGFSALPSGYYSSGSYSQFGYRTSFWSSTSDFTSSDYTGAIIRQLHFGTPGVTSISNNSEMGHPVRCVRGAALVPTVTMTSLTTNIDGTSATATGNVTDHGGSPVTARGVCWSTSHNPTISGSHTTDGWNIGIFTSNITGLTPGTTYYVRAYATNSAGTGYGSEDSFIPTILDGTPCPGTPTITDIDGNTYNTVKIGTQCWMKENLRTTKYADNTPIAQGSETSTTTAYWYYPNDDASNKPTYGLLYTWPAAMHGAASSETNPSNVQGICPTGWHVPSDAEWKQMEMAVGMSQSDADNMEFRGDIAARLCGNTGWTSSSTANAAGNTSATGRNSSGFSALPSGSRAPNTFGYTAYFWSATESYSTYAWCRSLNYGSTSVRRTDLSKSSSHSVRCVKN